MTKLRKYLLVGMTAILVSLGISVTGSASALPFSVNPILPKNQVNSMHTYYDLKVEPGKQQTLKVVLVNNTKKAVVVKPSISAAKTNINGVVDYSDTKLKLDPTAPVDMAKILTTNKSISIPAKSKINLMLKLQIPKKAFDGVLSGGITFKPVDNKNTNASKGVSVINKYAYVVGVVLRENNKPIKPVMKLNSVQPGQVNYRNVITSSLANKTAKYLNQVNVETKVTKAGDTKVLYSSKKEGMQIAPNSLFDYPTQLNGKSLAAGKYLMDLKLVSGNDKWHFKQTFVIEGAQARSLNKNDVTIKHDYTLWFIIAGVVLLLLIILFIILRLKKKEKELKAALAQQGEQHDSKN